MITKDKIIRGTIAGTKAKSSDSKVFKIKKNLTKEQMKKFEADIEKGNEIDLNDYLENTSVDYSNSLTRTTTNVSLKINKTLKIFLKDGFKIFEKFVK